MAPLSPTFDTLGPITRTVADARSFTEVLSGTDLSHSPVPIAGLRIAVLSAQALSPFAPEVAGAFRTAIAALESGSARVTRIELPLSLVEFQKLNGDIAGYEAYAHLKRRAEDWRLPMDPHVCRRVLTCRDMDRAFYGARLRQLADVRDSFAETLTDHDVLTLPGTPFCAPPMSEIDEAEIPMSRFTRIANCVDLCAICLPLPRGEGELPVGMQFCASSNRDAYLFALAESAAAIWED